MNRHRSSPQSPIGRCVYAWRVRKEMSFDQIRDATGLSKCILSRIENQTNPNPCYTTLKALASAFQIPFSKLLKSIASYE